MKGAGVVVEPNVARAVEAGVVSKFIEALVLVTGLIMFPTKRPHSVKPALRLIIARTFAINQFSFK